MPTFLLCLALATAAGDAAAPWSAQGGFSSQHGVTLVLDGYFAIDPIRGIGGAEATAMFAVARSVDLLVAVSGGPSVHPLGIVAPAVGARWQFWHGKRPLGLALELRVGLPVSVRVAPLYSADGTSTQASVGVVGVQLVPVLAGSWFVAAPLELEAAIVGQALPAQGFEATAGAGLRFAVALHAGRHFFARLALQCRIDWTRELSVLALGPGGTPWHAAPAADASAGWRF